MMKTKNKSGFSLIEIMVASLLLAVLALGGAAVLYRTGGGIQVYGNKRIAMEYARSMIETLKVEDYFVSRNRSSDDPVVTVETVNGVSLAITTDLTLHGADPADPDVGPLDNEYVELEIQVQYGRSADERVIMSTTKVLF